MCGVLPVGLVARMSDTEKQRATWRKAYHKYHKTEKGKQNMMNSSAKSYKKNHTKHIARATLKVYVSRGKITKPYYCEVNDYRCSGQLEGHHPDYSKPLEAKWLCTRHHTDLHLKLKQGLVV